MDSIFSKHFHILMSTLAGGALLPCLLVLVTEGLLNHGDKEFNRRDWLQAIGFLIIGTVALLIVGASFLQ